MPWLVESRTVIYYITLYSEGLNGGVPLTVDG